MTKKALIAGSSGLIGNELLHQLLDSGYYSEIISIVRKPSGNSHPKLVEHTIDFDKLTEYPHLFMVEDVFCCLGTTIKKAKSKEAFKKVDFHYPTIMANLSLESNCVNSFSVVSAIGADPNSSIFYNKVKGEMEQEISDKGITNTLIYRPSLLLGQRKDFRFAEKLSSILIRPFMFLFFGSLSKYKPIKAQTVAKAMISHVHNLDKHQNAKQKSSSIVYYKQMKLSK